MQKPPLLATICYWGADVRSEVLETGQDGKDGRLVGCERQAGPGSAGLRFGGG